MKTVKSYILGLAAAMAVTAGITACQDDFDTPALEAPVAVNQANTTIAELKAAYWQDTANYADSVGLREDGSHYIIKGRVISSDEDGNVFKFITIQDETGAINFSVNSYNLYLNYRRGQEIVVDATGMYIGKYAGLQQFGTPSYYENGSTWQVGFMSPEFFRQHIELNGVPEVSKLDTITVNSFDDFMGATGEDLRKWQSQLVRINNVHFQDGGVKTFSAYHSNANDDVNRTLIDAEGNSQVVVRTSGYANFWNKMLPAGSGDVVAILSYYENLAGATTWQLILNDYEGCMNFGNPTVAPGTESNPYTVAEVVKLEADGTPASGWVSGYIVGSVNPTENNPITNEDINWSAEALMPYTLVIGADKETTDLGSALVIELPADSPLRQLGNLRDNPGNYGKAISVRGTFAKVMGTYGVADNSGAASQFKIEGVQSGSEGVAEGDGTAEKPFNATQAKAKAIENGASSTDNVYVKGYIISGEINMTYGTGTWVIADNAEGKGETFTLYGTYNTDNKKFTDANAVKVGDLVVAVGPIYNYNSKTPEMSKGHLVSINGDGGSETPGPGPDDPAASGSGTEADPYNCAKLISLNPTDKNTPVATDVWVKGYIIGYMPSTNTKPENTITTAVGCDVATNIVLAPTAAETDFSKCVPIQLPTETNAPGIRSALNLQNNPGNLGKEVLLNGNVILYCGAPGLKDTKAYKFVDGGAVTPDPDPVSGTVYSSLSEDDAALAAGWTIDNVNIGSLEAVWSWKIYNNKGYLNASAYSSSGNIATEAYAISPVIDLTGVANPSLSFDHAAKFQTTLKTLCGVCIREEGTSSWTALTIPTWPEAGAWTFVNSGAVSMKDFAGKKVQVAFKYGSSSAGADTWEIKNLVVSAEGGSVTPDPGPGTGEDPVTPPATGDPVTIQATALTVPGTSNIDGYTIVIDKASGSTAPAIHDASSAVRLYADNTIEFKGQRMASITFSIASTNSYRYTTVTPSTGTISPAQAVGDTSFTWVGDASDVTFTIGHDATLGSDGASKRGQVHVTSITITPAK